MQIPLFIYPFLPLALILASDPSLQLNLSWHRSYLLLYCTLIYSMCFYFAHDYVPTLTWLLGFTMWLICIPVLVHWCHSWEEILKAEQLQAAAHENTGKGKQKLIFSSEITTVSNYTTKEITVPCKNARNKEPCKFSHQTLGAALVAAPPLSASTVHRKYSAWVIIYLIY